MMLNPYPNPIVVGLVAAFLLAAVRYGLGG